jgi:hypothetical protein
MGKEPAAMSTVSNYSDSMAAGGDSSKAAASEPVTGVHSTTAGEASRDGVDAADQEEQQLRASIEHTRADMSETIDELQERLNPANVKEMMKERLVEKVQLAKETIIGCHFRKGRRHGRANERHGLRDTPGIVEVVKANPIPSAMVGVGLAWLWMNRRDAARTATVEPAAARLPTSYSMSGARTLELVAQRIRLRRRRDDLAGARAFAGSGEGAIAAAGQARDAASKIASKARETVHDVTDKAQQTAGYVAERAQNVARGAQNQAVASRRRSFAS